MDEFSRSIRAGNTFLLLSPTRMTPELVEHIARLQRILGGRRIEPLHFTSQRFTFDANEQFSAFLADLKTSLVGVKPLVFYSTDLVPLYSEYRHSRVLKWRILPSHQLSAFSTLVEDVLFRHQGRSFFPRGWHSELITTLEHVDRVDLSLHQEEHRIPWPLFSADRVILSRFDNQEDYETLEEISLAKPL